jgi:hypothetical protein
MRVQQLNFVLLKIYYYSATGGSSGLKVPPPPLEPELPSPLQQVQVQVHVLPDNRISFEFPNEESLFSSTVSVRNKPRFGLDKFFIKANFL